MNAPCSPRVQREARVFVVNVWLAAEPPHGFAHATARPLQAEQALHFTQASELLRFLCSAAAAVEASR